MDKPVIYKYFRGEASRREEELILEWVEASEENRKEFQKERMLFDIALFCNKEEQQQNRKLRKRDYFISLAKWSAGIAASLFIVLSSGHFIKEYQFNKKSHQQTISVPVGQRAEIMLADGTKVWLNAKSTLTYAADFGKNNRNVELDGEAYFEVVKNSGLPFFVNTEYNRVKVVGTSFNVSAYKGSNEFETTLVEGIVDIYHRQSGKMITQLVKDEFFSAYENRYQKKYLHSYDFLRWREGLYCFDDTPFRCILDKLEKYYNVTIMVETPEILNYQCTGKFKENDGVEHILRTIRKDHPFSYTINESRDSILIR